MRRNIWSIMVIVFVISIVLGGCGFMGQKGEVENLKPDEGGKSTEVDGPGDDPYELERDDEGDLIAPEDTELLDGNENEEDFIGGGGIISDEPTIYTLKTEDGEIVYLDPSSPEVIAVLMAFAKYAEATSNIDWETADGMEGFDLLSPKGQEIYQEENMHQLWVEFYEKHKIVKEFVGVEEYNYIEFEGDTAVIDADIAFIYTNVKDLLNYKQGIVYYAPEKSLFRFVNGEWLMEDVLEARTIYDIEGD